MRKTVGALALLMLSCNHPMVFPPEPPRGVKAPVCGQERWDVKTLTDVSVGSVDDRVIKPVSIAAMNTLPKFCRPSGPRRPGVETTVYELEGVITGKYGEADGDWHVVLSDGHYSIIVESPSVGCAASSPFADRLATARHAVDAWKVGQRVRLRGVGFYDRAHGQRGMSISCVELHPILDVVFATTEPHASLSRAECRSVCAAGETRLCSCEGLR
jgi:hypothetical protein